MTENLAMKFLIDSMMVSNTKVFKEHTSIHKAHQNVFNRDCKYGYYLQNLLSGFERFFFLNKEAAMTNLLNICTIHLFVLNQFMKSK